ncbi:MAG: hypothetical protein Q3972_08000 [Corynebacterium sp.]|nr:hypothetical protein [Corynebacterium sp.]
MFPQFMKAHRKAFAATGLATALCFGTILPAHAIDLRYASAPDGRHCQYIYTKQERLAANRIALFENQYNTVFGLKDRINNAGVRDAWATWAEDYLYLANTLGTADYDAAKRLSQQSQDDRLRLVLRAAYGPRGINMSPSEYANAGTYFLNFDESLRNNFAEALEQEWRDAEFNASNVVITADPGNVQDFIALAGRSYLLPNDAWSNLMRPQAPLADSGCTTLMDQADINLIGTISLNPRAMLWSNDTYYRWRELMLLRDILDGGGKSSPRLNQMIKDIEKEALTLEGQADQQRITYDQMKNEDHLKYTNNSLIPRGTIEAQNNLFSAFLKFITSS